MSLSLAPHYIKIVKEIIDQNLPRRQVVAFGSRVTGTHKIHSDLDLCVMGRHPVSLKQLADLREAFTESDLPIRIDIVDWATLTPKFKSIIKKNSTVL